MHGVKSQDLVVLFKLVSLENLELDRLTLVRPDPVEDPYSVRALEARLGISKTEINAAIRRSYDVGLALKDRQTGRPRPNRRNLMEFVAHGLKFVFPAEVVPMSRGMPTGFDAPMLKGLLMSASDYIYVWPTPDGEVMGQGVIPLFKSVPQAARWDERLYEHLALVDAIRLGQPREAGLARDRLSEMLKQ